MRDYAAVIVAGLGVLASGAVAVWAMAINLEGWSLFCSVLCIGFAAGFSIEYSDLRTLRELQKFMRDSKPLATSDFPPQPKRPIR